MEELSSVGEQVFAAECILSKRLRKVRASPPSPLAHPALCAAHRPLFSPRRASWNTWSSGAAGPLSESPVRGRLPACASRPGWERRGDPLLSGPGGKFCSSGPGGRRPTGDALCLRAYGERAGRPPAPAPSGPALLRAARFWRPFVACAPALERAVAGAGHGPLPLPKLPCCNLRFLLVGAPPFLAPLRALAFFLMKGRDPAFPGRGFFCICPATFLPGPHPLPMPPSNPSALAALSAVSATLFCLLPQLPLPYLSSLPSLAQGQARGIPSAALLFVGICFLPRRRLLSPLVACWDLGLEVAVCLWV